MLIAFMVAIDDKAHLKVWSPITEFVGIFFYFSSRVSTTHFLQINIQRAPHGKDNENETSGD